MKFERLLINTRRNDIALISYALDCRQVNGIIVGDPFCSSRTGLSLFDIPSFARKARDHNLFVSYQTPAYLTTRNYDIETSIILELAKEKAIDEIRIQDIGLLNFLSGKLPPEIRITWSIYGYQREFPGMDIPLNQGQVDFLMSLGVNSFEVTTAVAYSILKHKYPLHMKMQVHHYKYDLVSFSRICYTEAYIGKLCKGGNSIIPAPANAYPSSVTVPPPQTDFPDLSAPTADFPVMSSSYCKSTPTSYPRDVLPKTSSLPSESSEIFPCNHIYYLQNEEKRGLRYVVEGHRILEFPDPNEFNELINSEVEIEALILEGNTVGEVASLLSNIENTSN